MPLAVQLFFDPSSEIVVRSLWEKFSITGICGYLAQSSSRPHISLSVFDDIPEKFAVDVIQQFSMRFAKTELSFIIHGRFPKTKIIFLMPKLTIELIEMQKFIDEKLVAMGAKILPLYSRQSWVPHCSLAMQADLSKAQIIYDTLDTVKLPLRVNMQEIGLVRFSPTIHLKVYPLTESSSFTEVSTI
jgi:hypothetical protein